MSLLRFMEMDLKYANMTSRGGSNRNDALVSKPPLHPYPLLTTQLIKMRVIIRLLFILFFFLAENWKLSLPVLSKKQGKFTPVQMRISSSK